MRQHGDRTVLARTGDYRAIYENFSWDIPARFNIGVAVCDYWADVEPERIAIVDHHPEAAIRDVSYGWLKETSNRLANLLRSRGVAAGDRVAILLPQVPETAAVHIAIYKLGAIAVPLAMLFGIDALQYRLGDSGAKALVMTSHSAEKLASIRDALPDLDVILGIDGNGDGYDDLHEGLARASAAFTAVNSGPDDPALMIYTSGTTGPPKGALHAHRVLLGHLPGIQFAHEFLPQPGDRLWTPSDWAWAGGLLNVLLPALYFGVPVVAYRFDKFDPDRAWALVGDASIRNAFVPPTALKMMRASRAYQQRDDIAMRTFFSGGEAVGRELQDWAMSTLGQKINEVYGQTECNLVLESCAALDVWRNGAIGKPVPGHTVAIVDSSGVVQPTGTAGTIGVKSPDPVMFLEYWDNPQATRYKYANGWLLTGDQGVMDEDGYFHFVGRDDDVITSSGYRIGPGEIEDCLISHPAVKIAAAVGKPDPVRTEIVKAFIVLNEGFDANEGLEEEIRLHVRNRLSAHEYPREFSFEKELPLTTTGKVIRRLLRERA